jgi:succinoglycan biosynthesis transport protein ExoP
MSVDRDSPDAAGEVPGLVRTLRILRERWLIIVGTTIVAGVAAFGYSSTRPKQYTATSKLWFAPNTLAEQAGGVPSEPDSDPEATKATNVLLVTTTEVGLQVAKDLKLPADIANEVTAASESDANIVDIQVVDSDPALAAKIATTWANDFVNFSRASDQDQAKTAEDIIAAKLKALPANSALIGGLDQELIKLELLEATQTGDARVIQEASVPGTPSAPKPKRDAVIAAALGLLLGIGFVFLLNVFDRRLKGVEEFEAIYGFGALATMPERSREPTTQRDRQAALEPFRILRNGLAFLGASHEMRVVMVTSAVPGEGKSTVASGLARAAALAGQRVILVECDLRRPTFQRHFELGNDPRGLTTALIGGVPVHELLRPVLHGLRALLVLPSGPTPPNAAELFLSSEMAGVLRDLSDQADLVVLDCPPLLPVADSHVLLDNPQIDACLIVGRAYHTTRDEARRARSVLDRRRLSRFGLVINGLRGVGAGYDYYGTVEEPAAASSSAPETISPAP